MPDIAEGGHEVLGFGCFRLQPWVVGPGLFDVGQKHRRLQGRKTARAVARAGSFDVFEH